MNLTEFAEQVVFGTTLEEKLQTPGKLTDEVRCGPSVESLSTPGRSADLAMQYGAGGNAQPPSDDSLEKEQSRGQLLHFLANHELLATELMALVLLKFPDAPDAFRQGVLATLKEEQAHTKMYLSRMQECGIEFGSFPLSGQFWRIVEPMQSPLDFVSRLSLTFEQANLDYSLHFAQVFERIDDRKTAAVLRKIYEDEIGHVQHGLHWFRQWKNPEQSDWEAYRQSLEFPMSPQRGRGPRGAFNREGRRQAGLSEAFIDAIEVFRQSRGRAPTVWWFDPSAEAELAGPISEKDEALLQQLAADLELVMLAMAKQDDVLLVHRKPSREFCKQLLDVGFDLPEFLAFDEREILAERKLHAFSPWAWTPRALKVAEPLNGAAHECAPAWQPESSELFRKTWAAERLGTWLGDEPFDCSTSSDCVGIAVHTLADVQQALVEFERRGYETALYKQDLSASGRGQRRLSCRDPLDETDLAWLHAMLGQGGIVEPELARVLDLSCLWHMPRDGRAPRYLGWTRQLVTGGRRFAGTRLGNALRDCESEIKEFLLADRCRRVTQLVEWLESRLAGELLARHFTGYFGVDALVCRDADGRLRIKPLVELNPRMTMGHVALNLEKRLAPGVDGEFRILTIAEWETLCEQVAEIPRKQSRDGHLQSGILPLSELEECSKLVPILAVGEQAMNVFKR